MGQPCEAMALLPHEQLMGAPEYSVSQHVWVPTTFLVGLLLPSSEMGAWTRAPRKPERQGITLSGRMTPSRVKHPG